LKYRLVAYNYRYQNPVPVGRLVTGGDAGIKTKIKILATHLYGHATSVVLIIGITMDLFDSISIISQATVNVQ